MTLIHAAQFIRAHSFGILSTQSCKDPGYPFGSLTPHIITDHGDIAIFISDLAEHTQNIKSNSKVCFTITDKTEASANPRLSCLADAFIVETEHEQLSKHYLDKFPNAETETILSLPGFNFYLLKIKTVHFVAGFGKVQWLTAEQLML
jgi:putative heme iron utilization protein